jgi:hypothetical protein
MNNSQSMLNERSQPQKIAHAVKDHKYCAIPSHELLQRAKLVCDDEFSTVNAFSRKMGN